MNSKKRKVAIYTGSRAEYGLLYPIIKALANDERFKYYLLVSGAHLDENFGNTVKEIQKDGVRIFATVKIPRKSYTLYSTTRAIGRSILGLSKILNKVKPDFFLVYGDRFESFSAVITSTQMNIPTVHIEGGDRTEGGSLDDFVRHAMSKLAHIHFTTNEDASERLRKMGEENWRIFTVGLPGIDLIKKGYYASPDEIKEKYRINLINPLIIYTQHSIATEYDKTAEQVKPALDALIKLANEGIQVIMTFPNIDAGAIQIMKFLKQIKSDKKKNIQVHKSIGRHEYHGFLNICGRVGRGVCAGNSSSGIKETPAFGCPVVNIGERQKGRLRAENIIDTNYDTNEIYKAVMKCLYDEEFRKKCTHCSNPYDGGNVAEKVVEILASIKLDLKVLQKKVTY